MSNISEINFEEYDMVIQDNVIHMACGFCGSKEEITLPIEVTSPYQHAKHVYRGLHEFFVHIMSCKTAARVQKEKDEGYLENLEPFESDEEPLEDLEIAEE